ncbi:hypothetical protein VCHC62B1_1158B, partial [Vibrio cholerae HC-62B1]
IFTCVSHFILTLIFYFFYANSLNF